MTFSRVCHFFAGRKLDLQRRDRGKKRLCSNTEDGGHCQEGPLAVLTQFHDTQKTKKGRERDGIGRLDRKIETGNAILHYDAQNSRDGHKVRNSEEEAVLA